MADHDDHEEHECDENCGSAVAIPINPQSLMAMLSGGAPPTEEEVDRDRMSREATQLRWMNCLDSLTDEQVECLHGMFGALANEGTGNYRTFMIHGMFEREKHYRKITPDFIGKGSPDE